MRRPRKRRQRPCKYSRYGENVTYQDNQVYYGNQPIATAEQYYQQASALAQSVPAADAAADAWMPLGVFALVRKEQTDPQFVMQLAVNKSGAIAGNYSDMIGGTNVAIQGAVDKKTQRAAWTVGKNKKHGLRNGNLQPDQRRSAGVAALRQGPNTAMDAGPAKTAGAGRQRAVTLIDKIAICVRHYTSESVRPVIEFIRQINHFSFCARADGPFPVEH